MSCPGECGRINPQVPICLALQRGALPDASPGRFIRPFTEKCVITARIVSTRRVLTLCMSSPVRPRRSICSGGDCAFEVPSHVLYRAADTAIGHDCDQHCCYPFPLSDPHPVPVLPPHKGLRSR